MLGEHLAPPPQLQPSPGLFQALGGQPGTWLWGSAGSVGSFAPTWAGLAGPSWHTARAARPGQLDKHVLVGMAGAAPGVAAHPWHRDLPWGSAGDTSRALVFRCSKGWMYIAGTQAHLSCRHLLREQSQASSSSCGTALTCHILLAPCAQLSLPPAPGSYLALWDGADGHRQGHP